MAGQLERIRETIANPDEIRISDQDETVQLFYRQYEMLCPLGADEVGGDISGNRPAVQRSFSVSGILLW